MGREVKRQDAPAGPDYQAHKEVATSPFLPTFMQPHQNIPSRSKELGMAALGSFDPSRYGAPPKKQKSISTPSQHVPRKTAPSEVASLETTVTPTRDQRSSSVTRSSVSETSYHAVSFQAQVKNTSHSVKNIETRVLAPKSTNRISIPGFDPSRYRKLSSSPRIPQSLSQHEAQVNTGSEAGEITSRTVTPVVNLPPTSVPHEQGPASFIATSNTTKKSQEFVSKFTCLHNLATSKLQVSLTVFKMVLNLLHAQATVTTSPRICPHQCSAIPRRG